nr:Phosphoenolpyruvate synthase (EC 2.7.9.2) [Kibdelosporangium sp. MJ126-NF4]
MRLTGGLGDGDRPSVGGKAVGLSALIRAGARIPETWLLPVGARPGAGQLNALASIADRWAVRSSASVEDGTALSYAGMFASELDVPAADLADAIARVQSSADSDRVHSYRERLGVRSGDVRMAVLLQPFQPPVCSGVWLGRGAGEGRLEWVRGRGDALVSGVVTPEWEEWTLAGKTGGSGELTNEGTAIGRACLALQSGLDVPADLEFAVLASGLVWLQFRPITTSLAAPAPRSIVESSAVVHGTPASPGTANGPALLVRDVADPAWKPGTVLLTEETDPDWVPLMAEAAALVTAEGGMLCHAAIVARELGVPCVTGVGARALTRLAAGSDLNVDGTTGKVTVL